MTLSTILYMFLTFYGEEYFWNFKINVEFLLFITLVLFPLFLTIFVISFQEIKTYVNEISTQKLLFCNYLHHHFHKISTACLFIKCPIDKIPIAQVLKHWHELSDQKISIEATIYCYVCEAFKECVESQNYRLFSEFQSPERWLNFSIEKEEACKHRLMLDFALFIASYCCKSHVFAWLRNESI